MALALDARGFGRRSCRGGGQDTCLYRHGVPVCPPFPRHHDRDAEGQCPLMSFVPMARSHGRTCGKQPGDGAARDLATGEGA